MKEVNLNEAAWVATLSTKGPGPGDRGEPTPEQAQEAAEKFGFEIKRHSWDFGPPEEDEEQNEWYTGVTATMFADLQEEGYAEATVYLDDGTELTVEIEMP